MSGFSPQGPGVQSGSYPGSQYADGDGEPGVNTYHVRGSTGPDGCPANDWSFPTLDDLNGIQQALNCILTNDGADPLPTTCAVDDPCILLDKLKELFTPPPPEEPEPVNLSCGIGQAPVGSTISFPDGSTGGSPIPPGTVTSLKGDITELSADTGTWEITYHRPGTGGSDSTEPGIYVITKVSC